MESTSSSAKRNVIFLSFTDLRLGAGTERVVLNLIANRPEKEMSIKIIETNYYDKIRISDEEINNLIPRIERIKINSIESKFHFMRKNTVTSLLYSIVLQPIIAKIQSQELKKVKKTIYESDIIYLSRNSDVRYLKKYKGIVIGSFHTISKLEKLLTRKGLLYNRIDYYHLLSAPFNKDTSLSDNRYFAIPNGVDSLRFLPIEKNQSGKIRFLFIGRLEKYKGIKTLIEAWAKLNNSYKAELHIVGGGSYENKILSLLSSHSNIVYHGLADEAKLQKIYGESDIFIYPTLRDIYPLVVLEALSSGLLVITSKNLRYTFEDFNMINAIEYVDSNSEALLDKMVEAIEDIQSIRKFKRKVHDYVQMNYDWHIISREFFEKILQLEKQRGIRQNRG